MSGLIRVWAILATVFVAIGAVAVAVSIGAQGSSTTSIIAIEAVAILFVAIGPLAVRLAKCERIDFFEPLVGFVILFIIVFTMRPLFIVSPWSEYRAAIAGDVYRYFPNSESAMAIALLYALIGLICFHLGYRSWRVPSRAKTRNVPATWNSRRVTQVVTIGLILSFGSLIVIMPVVGGLALIENVGRLRTVLAGYGYATLGLTWLGVVVILLWVDQLHTGRRRLMFVPLIAASNMFNIFLGSRAGVIVLWLSLAVAYAYYLRRRSLLKPALFVAVILAGGIVFQLVLGQLRDNRVFSGEQVAETALYVIDERSVGVLAARFLLDFAEFDTFSAIVHVGPEVVPFLWGRNYLVLPTYLIPRVIWPDKPMPFEVSIGETLTGMPVASAPANVVGELYVNFNVPGIMIGMFLIGMLLRTVYVRLITSQIGRRPDPGGILLYALMVSYLPVFTRSSVIGLIMISIMIGPAWLAVRYVRRPSPTRRRHALPVYGRPTLRLLPAPMQKKATS